MLYVCILGWVIDMDLEKFFDKVNHDKFMGILAKYIKDKSAA
jgi:retron-type reverse transcriptase